MIAEFLFRNPRILALSMATIVVAGVSSFTIMPRLEDPVLGKRVAVISTVYPGADAQQVESLVAIPIEERLTGFPEIKQVRSNCRTGIANIVIELKDEVSDVEPVWSAVQNELSDISDELPDSCLRPDLDVFPLKAFAAIVAVKSPPAIQPNLAILRRLANSLRADILEIEGTEQVETFGDPGEEFVAEISPATLNSMNLSVAAIAEQVSQSDADQPGGALENQESELLIDLHSQVMPAKRLSETLITFGSRGNSVQLAEIADIQKRLVEPAANLALIDGEPAIVLGALVTDDQQIDRWTSHLDQVIEAFESDYPSELTVDMLFSQRQHVDQRMLTLLQNLGVGTAAVVLTVLVLMGWRSMLVVGLALPLSALMVIVGMRLMSIPIHQMSVTGLIVALGLLIDNAIVVVEEVRSRVVEGATARDAIVTSVRHLAMPLFGSTLTTALAFLPIATLPGPAGEFVGTIAISVILAITASFALSMTVIPAMNGMLRINPQKRGFFSYGVNITVLRRLYEASLRLVFRFPVVGVVLGLLLPVWGFSLARTLPQQFFPPADRSQVQIEVERPANDSLAGVQVTIQKIQQIVSGNEEVQRQYWFLGGSAPTFYYNVVPRRRGTPFYAQAFVDLRSNQHNDRVVRDLQIAIDEQVFDSRVIVRELEQGPPFDAPIELRLIGPDLSNLQRYGSELRLLLSQTPQVIHTRSDLEETIPKLALRLDKLSAQQAGLSESEIAGQLYTSLEGASAGTIFDGNQELPVLIKLAFDGESKLDQLAALPLATRGNRPAGNPAAANMPPAAGTDRASPCLASLANFELGSDAGAIVRINGRRVNEVKAYIEAGVLPSVVLREFKHRLSRSDFSIPDGYELEFGGETEQRSNAVNKLIANAVILFALMLLTLVASFRSFRCALIVAIVGGLSAGLGPLALSLFGYPFGFMAIVGTMGLIGVAINDSIVILAAIRASEPSRAGDIREIARVVSGCTRHVIATTVTTIVGFTPLIVGGGGFWPPLAITIAGGVGGATLMALYFVPSLYLLLNPTRFQPMR